MSQSPSAPTKRSRSRGRFGRPRKRVCRICEHKITLTYKRPQELRPYMNRLGKILPRRATRFCARHQRALAREVKRARLMALLPYVAEPEVFEAERRSRRRR